MISALTKVARRLASLWLTLACLLAAAVFLVLAEGGAWIGLAAAAPFAVLCLNLLAALAVSAKLRRQGGLLVFHLALALLAVLAAGDRLTALSGHVEVTEGALFDPAQVEARTGPLHPWRLDDVRFVQAGFVVDYVPGVKRRETVSTVLVPDAGGQWRPLDVGDEHPLVAGDYRFYTSFNKGFAPVLTYIDARGATHTGAVHLPSYPLNHFRQGNDWALPDGSRTLKLWLRLDRPVYAEDDRWQFHKPENAALVVIDDAGRRELRPGASIRVGHGTLRYDELRSWMGYTISYNPITPWMLATVALAMLGFTWHVIGKFLRVPWRTARSEGRGGDAG